ncbi:MAG: hypothetical protein JNJ88_12970 [Planctomycetes bacterium]|nr:hypothetical protein [Planctomycetota bacterium]
MIRASLTGIILATCALEARAQTVTVTSSTHRVETQAFGYDWDFNNGEIDSAISTALSGSFFDTVFVDLNEWYGGHVGTGTGSVDSTLSESYIGALFDLYASCLNVGVFQADCSSVGVLDTKFTIHTRRRAVIDFEALCYDDYSWAFAYVKKVGAGPNILSLDVFGNDDGGAAKTTWLQVGNYEFYAEGNCGAFGTYGTSDDSTCVVDVKIRLFHEADYNASGGVDLADRSAFLAAYNAGSLNADFNGDGVLSKADRHGFLASWNASQQ